MKLMDYLDVELATPHDQIHESIETVKQGFRSGANHSLDARRQNLRDLYYALDDNKQFLALAFQRDAIRRNPHETMLEISSALAAIAHAINNLDTWAANEPVPFAVTTFLARPHIRKTPLGTVLIVVPWNFPILLGLSPLTDALAAGNTAIVKFSEAAPNIARALVKVLRHMNRTVVECVLGSAPQVTCLLQHKWDKILFTGGEKVGRVVAEAAAKHLTPCILELGGKSPVIVTKSSANLACATKRMVWSKLLNSGQICVSADYVLIDKSLESEFVQHFAAALAEFGRSVAHKDSPFPTDATRVVNAASFDRIKHALDNTSGHVAVGGRTDKSSLYIEPTLVTGVHVDDPLMQQEIFGPVVPVLCFSSLDEALAIVNRPCLATPLTLYIVSDSKTEQQRIMDSVQSGSVMINDFVLQASAYNVPFGGVGASGTGFYHGKHGFDQFSHQRVTFKQPFFAEPLLQCRYPPLTRAKLKALARMGPFPVTWMPRSGPVRVPVYVRVLFRVFSASFVLQALVVALSFYLGVRYACVGK